MIMLRSTHQEILKQAEALRLSEISQWESRISELHDRVSDLQRLVFIPKAEPVREVYEMDAVISGSEKPVEISEEQHHKVMQGMRELDLLTSGNYDEGFSE